MATRAGALAEIALTKRHREEWPRNLYSVDLDSHNVTGSQLKTEAPAGFEAAAVEYKAVDEGPLDLNDWQFQAVTNTVRDDLPCFAVQFTHPKIHQPWAFRLYPLNDSARYFGAAELTEQSYIQFLYLLERGAASAGGGVRTQRSRRRVEWIPKADFVHLTSQQKKDFYETSVESYVDRWSELAHLDDELPDPSSWPSVVQAKPRTIRPIDPMPRLTVRDFVRSRGVLLDESEEPAPVVRLPSRRDVFPAGPGPVALAREAIRVTQAPIGIARTIESDDRVSRLRTSLALAYRRHVWSVERASDDERDRWRAWDEDGTRRWR